MSTRLPGGGRFFTDDELLLLLPFATAVRATHYRNGLSTSPLLALADEIYNDALGIHQVAVYTADGKLVGMVGSNDVSQIGGGSGTDRLVGGRQNAPIDPSSIDPGEGYISTQEASDATGLPVRRVTEMLKKGQLTGHQQTGTRGTWLVEKGSVNRWVAEQQQPQ
jgi:hypothetical protein